MPLEQSGNAVIFYAFYTDSGAGKTGLTVTCDVIEVQTDGTATEIFTGQSATEIGRGFYRYRVAGADIDSEGEYLARFNTAGTVDQADIAAVWVIDRAGIDGQVLADNAITAAKIATDAITASKIAGGAIGASEIAAGAIGSSELAASAVTEIQAGLATAAALATAQADLDNPDQYKADLTGISTLTAAQVWAYVSRTLTMTAAAIAEALEGSVVSVYQYTTWTIALTGLGDISARSKLYFTVKGNYDDADDEDATILQVEETAGLLYIGGADAADPLMATLTVDNETTGAITVVVDDSVTGLPNQHGAYDVKMVTASGTTEVLTISTFQIKSVVTKAIT